MLETAECLQEKFLQRNTDEYGGEYTGERPNKHKGNAQRQKAYRERIKQATAAQMAAKGLPSLPVIPAMPGTRRWTLALIQAQNLTKMVGAEMQVYYDNRSPEWQDGARGEEFRERMEAVEALVESFDELLAEQADAAV